MLRLAILRIWLDILRLRALDSTHLLEPSTARLIAAPNCRSAALHKSWFGAILQLGGSDLLHSNGRIAWMRIEGWTEITHIRVSENQRKEWESEL